MLPDFEVPNDAKLDDIKSPYRKLLRVWHPDRFPNDPKFQKRATEKTKALNEAYQKISRPRFQEMFPVLTFWLLTSYAAQFQFKLRPPVERSGQRMPENGFSLGSTPNPRLK
jgi:curved DNA-binding protein CbpA